MPFNKTYRILIKNLYLLKLFTAQKLLKGFQVTVLSLWIGSCLESYTRNKHISRCIIFLIVRLILTNYENS